MNDPRIEVVGQLEEARSACRRAYTYTARAIEAYRAGVPAHQDHKEVVEQLDAISALLSLCEVAMKGIQHEVTSTWN